MAPNYHVTSGPADDEKISFPKPISYINIYVGDDGEGAISFDGGENFLTIPPGLHSIPCALTTSIVLRSNVYVTLVGVQA